MISYSKLSNPVILLPSGFAFLKIFNKQVPSIIIEYFSNGTLDDAFKSNSLSGTQKYNIFIGISIGMKFMHSNKIIHKNLNPKNIFLDKNFYPRICYFSQNLLIDNESNNYYAAPEVLSKKKFLKKSDVYSFALIAYQLLSGSSPFKNNGEIITKSKYINDLIMRFIKKCISEDPLKRPSFDEIFEEISKELYINNFKANEQEVFKYLDLFNIELTEIVQQKSIIYKIFKKNRTATIIESPNAKGDIFIDKYIIYSEKKYEIISISEKAFYNTPITSISFASDSCLKKISNYAFEKSKIRKIVIPASVENLDDFWIYGASELIEIDVDQENNAFSSDKGIFISKIDRNNSELSEIIFSSRDISGEYIVPPDIRSIRSFAFYKCQKLRSFVSKSSSLVLIGSHCFDHCNNLENISLTNASSINIENKCIYSNANLKTLEIESDKIILSSEWISTCPSLESIKLNIHQNLLLSFINFNDFKMLKNIILCTQSSLNLSKNYFNELMNLESIEISCNIINLNENCFYEMPNIQSITFKCDEIKIDKNCFAKCKNLSLITFQNVKKADIGPYAFAECDSLIKFKIITQIHLKIQYKCFIKSKSLQTVELCSGDLYVSFNIFEKCVSLLYVFFESTHNYFISNDAFNGCTSNCTIDKSKLKALKKILIL